MVVVVVEVDEANEMVVGVEDKFVDGILVVVVVVVVLGIAVVNNAAAVVADTGFGNLGNLSNGTLY